MSNSFNDVFSNPSNDYIYPGLSPCPNVADDQYLRWTEDGLAIIKGSEEIALIGFSDLGIPVNSFNKQQIILEGGEVSFIPGLDKGLCKKNYGFTMPSLVSTDEDLNEYFFQMDLSVNYYKNFSYTYSNIDVSANYSQNISISDALNIALSNLSLKITTSYDPSTFSFTGTQDGYDFTISNVVLSVIDASENSSSPFAKDANADSYTLSEDPSAFIPNAKYPNTAMQGVILRGIYPDEYNSYDLQDLDKWININHVSDYVITYDPVTINYNTDVSSNLAIVFDPSTYIGDKPIVADTSCLISDISIGAPDSSITFTSILLDDSISDNVTFVTCTITNSSLGYDFFTGGTIVDSSVSLSEIYDTTIADTYIEDSIMQGDPSFFDTISSSIVEDVSAKNYIFNSTNIYNSYLLDASIVNGDASLNIYDSTAIWGSTIEQSEFICTDFKDTSIYNSYITKSMAEGCDIYDSSIIGNSIINDKSKVSNSYLENVWTNTYRLLVYTDPSTGEKTYQYIIDDPTLDLDSSSNRIEINESIIWDSSINNAIIYDTSIYNSYIEDSSLVRCTTYNCSIDSSTTFLEDSREIMIDPSIGCEYQIINDTSTYYLKHRKKLEIGMSGSSTEGVISAGDYLNWVTTNDMWKKVGDMYIWTSATDDDDCTVKNLIDGFYVYNPHEFPVQIEYLTFV